MRIKKLISFSRNYLLVILLTGLIALAACAQPTVQEQPANIDAALLLGESTPTILATSPTLATLTATIESQPSPTSTLELPTITPLPTPTPLIHVVQEGQVLVTISELYSVPVAEIQAANNLADPNNIYVGDELIIPLGTENEQEAPPLTATDVVEAAAPTVEVELHPTHTVSTPGTFEPGDLAAPTSAPVTTGGSRIEQNGIPCPENLEFDLEGGEIIGVSDRCALPIVSHKFGDGETPVILIGGIHGGYEWNTITLAYDILDALNEGQLEVPPALTFYLIPNANPDGLYAVSQKVGRFYETDLFENTVPGRFNGNNVDLNRNWDCDWEPVAMWGNNEISGGTEPFSEKESRVLRDYIVGIQPEAVVFLHSAAHGVFAAGCDEVDPASRELADIYGAASGYPVHDGFQHYEVTGDAGDWLASKAGIPIPSISVELTNHQNSETSRNINGLKALMADLAGQEADSE